MYFLLTTRPVPDISLAPEELGVPSPSVMAPGARIPYAIDVIVMRALSDVDDRYPTAADMAHALREALTQPDLPTATPFTVPEATLAAPAGLVIPITRTPVTVGLGVGLALCGIVVAALWNVGAAQGGGHVNADQAMNLASTPDAGAAVIRRREPAAAPPNLLPPAPPEPQGGGYPPRHAGGNGPEKLSRPEGEWR